jgi:Ni,Fe-hydrogenase III large subunit/Ni,Fe-hydrogenase III component G
MSGYRDDGAPVGHRRTASTVDAGDLVAYAGRLLAAGFRLALVAAHHDRPTTGDPDALRVVYLFLAADPDRRVEVHVHLEAADPRLPTLAGLSFPASRFEREMHDLYGITPVGHPLPRRLVRHPHWPAGWYPMRHDAHPPADFTGGGEPFPFLTVDGPGVYEIPVGPVHAGLIEPGHFRFSVVGETILKLKARLWYVHKGIEKLFHGRTPADGIPLAERVSGDTAVGHTLAYVQAVEDALAIDVPPAAQRARAILLELERLYNHVGDIGALCNDVAHGILHAHAMRVRETLLRLNADTTGHRLLRGGITIGGGLLRGVPDPAKLAAVGADITDIVDLALGNSLVRERFTGTAVLTRQQALDLGTLGYVARASGIATDARRDHPTGPTQLLPVPVQTGGDVLARFQQRATEIIESLDLLQALAGDATPGDAGGNTRAASLLGPRTGVGIVEGWRGTIVHRVELDPDGRLTRNKIVDPSFHNWPALPVALQDTIVADFPLVNKSFNLSYAGNDL